MAQKLGTPNWRAENLQRANPPLMKPVEGQSLPNLVHDLMVKERQLRIHLDAMRKYPQALHFHNHMKTQLLQIKQPPSVIPRHMVELLMNKFSIDSRTANTILEQLPLYQIRILLNEEISAMTKASQDKNENQKMDTDEKVEVTSTTPLNTQRIKRKIQEVQAEPPERKISDRNVSSSQTSLYGDLFDPVINQLRAAEKRSKEKYETLAASLNTSSLQVSQPPKKQKTKSVISQMLVKKVENVLFGQLPKDIDLNQIVQEVLNDEAEVQRALTDADPETKLKTEVKKILKEIKDK